jgi:hypothetical protein
MNTTTKEPGKSARKLGIIGLSLCALCCALPIIGLISGAGILSVLALYAEKIAVVLLVLSAASFGVWFYHKRQAPACSVDCSCKQHSAPEEKVES